MQEREKVREGAEWYVYSHDDLTKHLKRTHVAVIGSGAWACAAARMVAQNTASPDPSNQFAEEVKMWVYEEQVDVCLRPLLAQFSSTNRNVCSKLSSECHFKHR